MISLEKGYIEIMEYPRADKAFIVDAAAGAAEIRKAVKAHPELQSCRALREGRMAGLPYYCRPLEWKAPMILESWADALAF